MTLQEQIKKLEEIINKAKIIKALPLKEPAEHEDGVECPFCRGEGLVEAETAEFETHYESITAGIQCFGYGDQLNASMELVDAIPDMWSIIKKQEQIIEIAREAIFNTYEELRTNNFGNANRINGEAMLKIQQLVEQQ